MRKKNNYKRIEHDFFIIDDVVYFLLKGRGKKEGIYAMISENKWPLVSKYEWYLGKTGYPFCYSLRKIQLHRFIFCSYSRTTTTF